MSSKNPAKRVVLEVHAIFPESQFSLDNEIIDLKDEIENFTLFEKVEVIKKSEEDLKTK